ncbi:phosphate ABC transporter substrate-binding protein PstS [Fimbriiglobus ruber]|uniref:Phosphate-binding protein n=1 Tax=Fimbriiglobus ruber TaxID=1908690 RepID=A0A225D500_9BACT|nr:phosphate ABC transporter substrate-binding protein PstS [Fimbriiglobus ruber]OWK36023.1 Phosphate ABC transporter, periplasmic phosphate-binding protein PstS [Fimbriiglobus ruber]
MNRSTVVRLLVIILVGAGLGTVVYYSPGFFNKEEIPTYVPLKTGGTSVAQIILENRWKSAFREKKNVEIAYDSTGSTAGVTKTLDGEYAIGFVHAPLTDKQKDAAKTKGGDVVHVPVVVCAVVPVYHVKELEDKPPLNFTADVLAGLFLGKIAKWNDPALKAINPGVALPDLPVVVVHRGDSSGTTALFTEYLADASELWRKEIGPAASEVKWPVGVGVARSQGMADTVHLTEGAIGYLDLVNVFNIDLHLQHGAVQNHDKTGFIRAEAENMTAAAGAAAGGSGDAALKLTNRSGANAYPICGIIWAVCYQSQPAAHYKNVSDFLQWATHDGQKFAGRTAYAPLPAELVTRGDQAIQSIKSAQ